MTPQDPMRLAQIKAIAKAAAEKFMTWELPQDFYPDNYIEFDKKYALERGIWPTGTNLMHVGQAQAMFEHCLAEALAQQDELGNASKAEQLLASHDHSLRAEFGRMKAALSQQSPISDVTEAVTRTVIDVEKLLCEKLGKQWRPSGMSIQTLVDELAQQGEQQPDYDRGWKEGYKHGAWSAAPAAQPIMETYIKEDKTPLTENAIDDAWYEHVSDVGITSTHTAFQVGVRVAEKHHGIGVRK